MTGHPTGREKANYPSRPIHLATHETLKSNHFRQVLCTGLTCLRCNQAVGWYGKCQTRQMPNKANAKQDFGQHEGPSSAESTPVESPPGKVSH